MCAGKRPPQVPPASLLNLQADAAAEICFYLHPLQVAALQHSWQAASCRQAASKANRLAGRLAGRQPPAGRPRRWPPPADRPPRWQAASMAALLAGSLLPVGRLAGSLAGSSPPQKPRPFI
eukprot:351082-Chlamydomonas_euryale.AAC.4